MAEKQKTLWHKLLRPLELAHLLDWIAHGSIWASAWSAALSALVALSALLQGRDPVAYVAFGFFGAFALMAVLSGLARYFKDRRGRNERKVDRESVEQLRQIFDAQFRCTSVAAAQYLKTRFLLSAQPEEFARFVSKLLDEYAFPAFMDAYKKVHPRIEETEFEESEFADLIDAVNDLTTQYIRMGKAILGAGQLFFHDGFLAEDRYESWYTAHKKFSDAISKVKDGHGLRRIRQTLPGVESLLPEPKAKTSIV
jgi:hypothetical protein